MELDELDMRLAALLQQDARMPMVDIAKALGITRQTATKRLDRLVQGGLLHLIAETDFYAAGKDYLLVLGISCEGQPVDAIANQLAEMEETLVVVTVTGRFDIEAVAAVETLDAMNSLLTKAVPAIKGITSCSPSLCLEVMKFESNKIPYTP